MTYPLCSATFPTFAIGFPSVPRYPCMCSFYCLILLYPKHIPASLLCPHPIWSTVTGAATPTVPVPFTFPYKFSCYSQAFPLFEQILALPYHCLPRLTETGKFAVYLHRDLPTTPIYYRSTYLPPTLAFSLFGLLPFWFCIRICHCIWWDGYFYVPHSLYLPLPARSTPACARLLPPTTACGAMLIPQPFDTHGFYFTHFLYGSYVCWFVLCYHISGLPVLDGLFCPTTASHACLPPAGFVIPPRFLPEPYACGFHCFGYCPTLLYPCWCLQPCYLLLVLLCLPFAYLPTVSLPAVMYHHYATCPGLPAARCLTILLFIVWDGTSAGLDHLT